MSIMHGFLWVLERQFFAYMWSTFDHIEKGKMAPGQRDQQWFIPTDILLSSSVQKYP